MTAWALLLLVVTANGAPLIGNILGKQYCNWPLDCGLTLANGQRLLGGHKTVRGVVLAVLFTAVVAWLLGLKPSTGIIVGLAAMAGDIAASFVKRRLAIAPGGMAIGLDQLPEALAPLAIVGPAHGLSWGVILALGLMFLIFELAVSRLLYRLHLRKHPY